MTNPGNTPGRNTPSRFAAGAIDLGQLKKPNTPAAGGAADGQIALANAVGPETFEGDLVMPSTKVLVVTQIGSSRAPESDQMRAEFEALAAQQDASDLASVRWLFRYVDVDQHPEIAQAFKVQAVPTVIALAAGRPLTQFEGVESGEQLQQWIAALLQAVEGKLPGLGEEPADPRLAQAAELLDSDDTQGAIELYDQILAEDPKNQEVIAARAQALVLQRAEDSGDVAEDDPFAQADQFIVAGQKAKAFSVLIDRIKETSGEQQEEAKKRLFELFAMFEAGDPEVIAARTEMASALF